MLAMGFPRDLILLVLESTEPNTPLDDIVMMLTDMGGGAGGEQVTFPLRSHDRGSHRERRLFLFISHTTVLIFIHTRILIFIYLSSCRPSTLK